MSDGAVGAAEAAGTARRLPPTASVATIAARAMRFIPFLPFVDLVRDCELDGRNKPVPGLKSGQGLLTTCPANRKTRPPHLSPEGKFVFRCSAPCDETPDLCGEALYERAVASSSD